MGAPLVLKDGSVPGKAGYAIAVVSEAWKTYDDAELRRALRHPVDLARRRLHLRAVRCGGTRPREPAALLGRAPGRRPGQRPTGRHVLDARPRGAAGYERTHRLVADAGRQDVDVSDRRRIRRADPAAAHPSRWSRLVCLRTPPRVALAARGAQRRWRGTPAASTERSERYGYNSPVAMVESAEEGDRLLRGGGVRPHRDLGEVVEPQGDDRGLPVAG